MIPSRKVSRRALLLLCLASAGWAFSFGLGGHLTSLWLEQTGVNKTLIGLNTSIYYIGVALAAPLVPRFMSGRAGTCVLVGMILDGLTTALFPWVDSLPGCYFLRFVSGVGTALSLIPMETLVNQLAPPERRARDFGFYAFSVALGIGLGSIVGLNLFPLAPKLTFLLGGVITLSATLLLLFDMPWHAAMEKSTTEARSTAKMPRGEGWLCFGAAWAQGFLEGGMLTFLALYLISIGYSDPDVGSLLGVLFLGVLLAQLPLSWIADRFGELPVLLICLFSLLTGLALLPFFTAPFPVACCLFLLGVSCGALYPLGLALLGERVPSSSLAWANGWYLAINCAGSVCGPLIMGWAIDSFGRSAQFAAGAGVIVLVIVGWLALKPRKGQLAGDAKDSHKIVNPQAA